MQPGEVVGGRFEVLALAGAGGMGTVYRARDGRDGGDVALKVLSEAGGDASRLFREARVLSELAHPAVVRHVAHGTTPEGRPGLAMEWLDGESLEDRLARRGLTVRETLELGARVAAALGAAHARGIVHRDVKPSNVFLPGGDLARAKVLDFGLARLGGASVALTRSGMVVGTPAYMAPEQVRGTGTVDARADVFALGCVLYECLAGTSAFQGGSLMAVFAKVLLEEPRRLSAVRPEVPEEVARLVHRLLEKEPAARPANGSVAAAEIAGLLESGLPLPGKAVASSPSALGSSERLLLSVVLVGPSGAERPGGDGETVELGDLPEALARAGALVSGLGGRLESLADGSILVTLRETGVATDQTERAARCALVLRELLPDRPIALATGLGEPSDAAPAGEVIDRAALLLSRSAPGGPGPGTPLPILLDPATAGLLERGFDVQPGSGVVELRGERARAGATRTLLGREVPFVGRDRELAVVEALVEETFSEPGARALLVSGQAGVGKSRLLHEVLRRLRGREVPAEVLIGRGDPVRAGEPFALLRPVLRRAAGIREGDEAAVAARKLRSMAEKTLPPADAERVASALGELLGLAETGRGDALVAGDRMRWAFEDWLAGETRERPLAVVLEDLHWGDLPSVTLLDAALAGLAERPLLVVALARPEVHEVFPRLWSGRRLEEIRLAELPRRACERLARSVLGEALSDAEAARLAALSGGNPFFLEELLRAAAEKGTDGPLPETVLAMLGARLSDLEPEARRVLRAASVFGPRASAAGVRALLGDLPAREVDAWLEELSRRELLLRLRPEPLETAPAFAFRHALVRDAAYATLTGADRVLGHRLAGTWLEAEGGAEPGLLAEHLERGGEPLRAAPWLARAAVLALRGNDFAGALERAARGLACGAAGPLRGSLLLVQAEAFHWRGEAAEAAARAEDALGTLEKGTGEWFAAAALLATTCGRLARNERLAALSATLEEARPASGAGGSAHVARAAVAVALLHAGRYAEAERLLALLDGAAIADDPFLSAWRARALAIRAAYAGDPAGSLALMAESAAAFEKAGDLRTACQQRGNAGYLERELGLLERAEASLRKALADAERLGLSHITPTVRHNLGLAVALRGDRDGGLALEAEAASVFARQGDRRFEGASRIYLARIQLLRGDAAEAAVEARRAVELLAGSPPARAYALGSLAEALLALGGREEALAAAREGVALADEIGGMDEGESALRLALAAALAASGDGEAARDAWRRARESVFATAGRITDPAVREAFLALPENARAATVPRPG